MPAAEVGGEESSPAEGDVRRVAESVSLRIGDQRAHSAVQRDAENRARLVAADIEVPDDVEGEPVWEEAGQLGDDLRISCRAVLVDRYPDDTVRERLGDEERAAVGSDGDAVGEVERGGAPELALAVGLETEDPRTGLFEAMAVGHVQAPVGVERESVGDTKAASTGALGEGLEPIAGSREPEHRRRLQVAEEEVSVRGERDPEREAARAGDLFERRAVGCEPVELASLAAAPDDAVSVDGHALGVVEPRPGQRAGEEDADRLRPEPGPGARLGRTTARAAHRRTDVEPTSRLVSVGVTETVGSAKSVLGTSANQPGRPGSRS